MAAEPVQVQNPRETLIRVLAKAALRKAQEKQRPHVPYDGPKR